MLEESTTLEFTSFYFLFLVINFFLSFELFNTIFLRSFNSLLHILCVFAPGRFLVAASNYVFFPLRNKTRKWLMLWIWPEFRLAYLNIIIVALQTFFFCANDHDRRRIMKLSFSIAWIALSRTTKYYDYSSSPLSLSLSFTMITLAGGREASPLFGVRVLLVWADIVAHRTFNEEMIMTHQCERARESALVDIMQIEIILTT